MLDSSKLSFSSGLDLGSRPGSSNADAFTRALDDFDAGGRVAPHVSLPNMTAPRSVLPDFNPWTVSTISMARASSAANARVAPDFSFSATGAASAAGGMIAPGGGASSPAPVSIPDLAGSRGGERAFDASVMASLPAGTGMSLPGAANGSTLLAQAATSAPVPPADASNPVSAINSLQDQLQNLLPGSTLIIAGKTAVGLPETIFNFLPPSFRDTISPNVPLVMAWILPATQLADAFESATAGRFGEALQHLGSAAANSTVFLGTSVGESIGPIPNQLFGNPIGQILTMKFNGPGQSPTFEARQGIAFGAQGMGPGYPTWAFVNSGGAITPVTTQDSSADGLSVDLNAQVGAMLIVALLFRIPGTETALRGLGASITAAAAASSFTGLPAAALGLLAQFFTNSTGLYVGPGLQVARVQLDAPSGEMTLTLPGNTRYGINALDAPAFIGDAVAPLLAFSPDAARWADNLQPTRNSLDEIIDTPTNRVAGVEVPNAGRLDLYWKDYTQGRDLVSVAWGILDRFGSANPAQRSNLSDLYWRPELEPARLLFQGMFGIGPDTIEQPRNLGKDGYFGIDDIGVAVRDLKERLTPDQFQARLRTTAKLLIGAGWYLNFGVPALQQQIDIVRDNLPPAALRTDPLTNTIAPLYRPGTDLDRAGIDGSRLSGAAASNVVTPDLASVPALPQTLADAPQAVGTTG